MIYFRYNVFMVDLNPFELCRLVISKEHSRAWYRIGATRVFSGSRKVHPQLSMKLKEVCEYLMYFILFLRLLRSLTGL